ncbi:MAG: T9SS type B sorting domain-containing protein, partial [Capnocytophaga sp.]|nr:T9SS type B sorting domain-containing protein [Capnocytophaga sp.]
TCIYEIEKTVLQKTPKLKLTVTNPLCKGGNGSLQVQLSDAPYYPYTYKVYKDNISGALVEQKVITSATDAAAAGFTKALPAGIYVVVVENNDGCNIRATDKIIEPTLLKLDVAPHDIMCNEGTINVSAQGGTKDSNGYTFELYKATTFIARASSQASHTFTITDKGAYTVKVIDANNCETTKTITIQELPAPTIGAITPQLYDCGAKVKIVFPEPKSTVSYTYEYSLISAKQTSREFLNLTPGQSVTPRLYYTYGGKTCQIDLLTVQLPNAANGNLIASAGVAQLVGCGTGVNAGKALVHFTNVQGGVGTITYNFGDGVWTTTSSKWLAPGTYNLSVKDGIGCARTNLKVEVKDKPKAPVFSNTSVTYTCDGKGTVTIKNDKLSYTYKYQLDGGAETTTAQFSNLPPGIHTITIKYDDPLATQPGILLKEDFGKGNPYTTPPPRMTPAYTLIDPRTQYLAWNMYFVAGKKDLGGTTKSWWNGSAHFPNDHTNPSDNSSRYLAVDFGPLIEQGAIFYEKDVTDVLPNQPIEFEMFGFNLVSSYSGTECVNPVMIMEIVALDDAGNIVQEGGTDKILGRIESQEIPQNGNNMNACFRFASDGTGVNTGVSPVAKINPGTYKHIKKRIRTKWNTKACNDFAFDDVTVYQVPESCGFTATHTVKIEDGKGFAVDTSTEQITSAKCKGELGQYKVKLKNMPNGQYYYAVSGYNNFNFNASTPNNDTFVWNGYAGNYTVKFRGDLNNPNCEFTRTFTITQPAVLTLSLDASKSDTYLACNPATARVTMTATGGTLPYSYALYKGTVTITAAQTSPQFTLTQTGTYRVIVTDANGCQQNNNFTIINAPVLTLTGTTDVTNNNYCMSSAMAGKVQVKVTDAQNIGTAPYTFFHNGMRVASQTAAAYTYTNLQVGVHTFTVVDKYGCTASYTTEIKRMITVDGAAGAVVAKDITCHSGNAAKGEITLKIKDGYAPYTYIVKNVGTNATVQTQQNVPTNRIATYKTEIAGVYRIEVTDSKGCTVSGTATLTAATNPTITYTATAVVCYGANDGTISLTISGGTAPYKVKLDNGAVQNVTGNQHRFVGVTSGSRVVYVTDARECKAQVTINITSPAAPLKGFAVVSQLIGCGDGNVATKNKAQIRFTNVTGGYGDYSYRYDGNFTTNSEGWLPAGTHTVTVKDKGGCQLDIPVEVPERITPPTGTSYTITTYDCEGKGTIRISGLPNTYNYTYIIDGKTATGTTATITGLAPGSYTMTIKYTQGAASCPQEIVKTVVIPSGQEFKSSVVSQTQASCNGLRGKATFKLENLRGGSYQVSVAGTTRTGTGYTTYVQSSTFEVDDLRAGTHTITFNYRPAGSGGKTCAVPVPVTITEPAALTLTSTVEQVAMCSNNFKARVKLTAGGGNGGYNYTYLVGGVVKAGPQSSNIFATVATGTATFEVKDSKGCVERITTVIATPRTVSLTLQATDCYAGDSQGVVTVTITDGNGGYSLRLNNGATVSPSTTTVTHSFRGLTQGSYSVTVTDQYGCSAVSNIIIYPSLNFRVKTTQQSACGSNAKIEVIASGSGIEYAFRKAGTLTPLSYSGTNNVTPSVGITTETWEVYVRAGRCVKTQTVTLARVAAADFTASVKTPTCVGTGTGEIVLKDFVGGTPFSVGVTRPGGSTVTQTGVSGTYTVTNAIAGVYTITVKDVYGCSSVRTFTIVDKPSLASATLEVDTSVACPGVGNPTTLKLKFDQATFNAYNTDSDIWYRIGSGVWTKVTSSTTNMGAHPSFLPGKTVSITYKTTTKGGTTTICTTEVLDKIVPNSLKDVVITVQTNMNAFASGCTGLTQGMVATVTASAGGTGNLEFSIDNNHWVAPTPVTARTYVWNNLTPGRTYKFYVRDAQGCIAEAEGDIYSGTTEPAMQVGLTATPACAGQNGQVSFTIKRNTAYRGTTPITVNWQLYELPEPIPANRVGTAVPGQLGSISVGLGATTAPIVRTVAGGKTYYVEITEGSCKWGSRDAEVKQLAPITATVTVNSKVTCDTAGVIEVLNTQGGGGQYTYTLSVVSGGSFITPIATANNRIEILRDNVWNSNNLEYPSGIQTITVRVHISDQYGCPETLGDYDIGVHPKPKVYEAKYTGCSNGTFAITVTPTVKTVWAPSTDIADYDYSIDGGLHWQERDNVFRGLSAGEYPIVLKERATGCEGVYTVTIYNPLEASAQVSKPLGCGAGQEAEIAITVDKGSGSYSYDITPPSGAHLSGNPFTAVVGSTASKVTHQIPLGYMPGIYTVTVTDTNQLSCSPTIVVLTVASATYPEIEVSTRSVTCAGSADGQLFVVEKNAPNGGAFSYAVTGPGGAVTFDMASRSANNLVAGIYTITVTNTLTHCDKTYTATVYSPTGLTFSHTLITTKGFTCSNGNTPRQAEIRVPSAAISGGTGSVTITYVAPNGSTGTGNVFNYGDPAGGVVTITITDASGCATSTVRTITAYEGLDAANITVSSTITCGTDTVTLSITQTGGVAFTAGTIYYAQGATAPTVAIGTAPWQLAGTFAVTPNATHKFWIGHKDTGCMIGYDYTSPNPNTFSIAKVAIKNVSCKGDSDGTVTLTLAGMVSTHTYNVAISPSAGVMISPTTLTGGANVVNFSGLAKNTYTVTITNQNTLCEQIQVFTIAEPTVSLTATTSVRSITCANNDGEIRIENVSGGWGAYQYYIDTVAPTPTSGAWTSTSVRSGLVSATYHIAVRDNHGKGCQVTVGTITLTGPETISGTLTVTQKNCVAGTGEISVQSVTGGDGVNYTYQLIKDGVREGIAQGTRTFTGLGAGSYEVVVSDSWGCSATLTAVTLYEPISGIQVAILKEVTCASPTGATLSITHQGGTNSLTYTLTRLGGGVTTPSSIPVFTGVPAGNYIVGVKDNKTVCATKTTTIEVTPAVQVAFTYTQTNVSCHGGNNGRIDVTIPGTQTQTDYVMQIEGAGGFTTRTETVNTTPKTIPFPALKAGVYTVTVRSSRACEQPQTITITEPDPLVVSSTTVTTHFSCDANNQARQAIVQAVAAGGATGTYTYNFVVFDGQSTSTTGYTNSSVVSISSNGSYTQTVVVYVRDANNCEANNVNSPTVIPPLKRITAIKAQQTRPIDCQGPEAVDFTIEGGSNQGYIVRVTGGTTTPSIYTVTSGVSVVSVTFTAPGYYEVTVTDSATGCYDSVNYGIANYDNMSISAAQTKPVTCAAGNDGELTLSMRGYAGNYTFRVVNEYGVQVVSSTAGRNDTSDPRTQPIVGLSAGKYYVEVTETQYPYCTKTATLATLSGPSSALTASTTITNQIKCGSGQTGSFMVTAAGGWGNYEYRLTVGTPTPAAHSVYGNYSSTSVFEGLVSETYTVWVKDQNGCETSVTQVMSPPAPIAATVTKTDVKCFSERGGSITVSGTTGGSGNYTYELWEVGGAQIYGAQTSTTFTGLDAREYNVKIVDGWNCDLTIPVTIDEPQEIKVTASIVSPTTCLQTQATIQVTATGGSGGYQYQLGGTTTYTTSNLFTLPPGTYEFYVQDVNYCKSAASNKVEVVAVQTVSLTVNTADAVVKCNGEATARITFSATGGVGGYQYSLHQGSLTAPAMTISATQINATDWAFSGLAIGKYYVKVKSGVDCEDNSPEIDIREADAISVTSAVTNITCKGEKDGKIIVTATGGTGTIVYAISPRFDRVVERGEFKDLSAGEYVVRIQDANGCHRDEIFKITEPDLIRVRIDRQTDEVCYGANDGTISVTITGGTQSYSTSIDGGANWHQGKTLYTGLASGTYTIKVKDAMSCTTESDPITIKGGVDLQATATVEYSCPSNSVNNAVRVRVNTDVAAQTTFALDGVAQASNYFTSVTAGVHTITVRHQGGCVQTLTVNVENYAPLSKTVSVTHITCYGLTNSEIQINVTGGTGSYTYSITPQAGTFSGTNMFVNLPKGQYTIQVKDAVIGCEVSERITIEEPDVLKLGVVKTVTETCYQQSDGQLEFMIQGGRAPYSYELKDPQGNVIDTRTGIATGTTVSRTNMAPGTYSLEFRDGNCSQTHEITIAAAPSLQATATVGFECSTVSTTSTNPYIQITLARDNSDGLLATNTLSYSIDGGVTKKPFVGYVNGNMQVLRTQKIENDGVYTVTLYYRPLGMTSLCSSTLAGTVSVTRYPGLEILDKTDPREINKVRVKVVGGNPYTGDTPYSITFNGSYENGESEYMLKPTDPTSRVVNGRIFKLVVVEATDANNCSSTLTIEKEYMKSVPPDFFTPNGDGQNDGWDPDIYRSYPNLTVDIYDRYGRYIKTLRSGQVWDGRYEGKEMPSGDYWYILRTHEDEDQQEYMGHFTLYR